MRESLDVGFYGARRSGLHRLAWPAGAGGRLRDPQAFDGAPLLVACLGWPGRFFRKSPNAQ